MFSDGDIIIIGGRTSGGGAIHPDQEMYVSNCGGTCTNEIYFKTRILHPYPRGTAIKIVKRAAPSFGFNSTPTTTTTVTDTTTTTATDTTTQTETTTNLFSYYPTIPPTYTPQTPTCDFGTTYYLKMMSVFGNTIDRDSNFSFNSVVSGQNFTIEPSPAIDPHISPIEWASCWKVVGSGTTSYNASGNKGEGCYTPGAYVGNQCHTKEFTITNNGSSNWIVSGTDDLKTHTNASNGTITVSDGDVLILQNNADSSHPIKIYDDTGNERTSVGTIANSGAYGGSKLYFAPNNVGTYYYKCGNHPGVMVGEISVTGTNPSYPRTPTP